MAKCDQGYVCEVCGQPVPNLLESSLYLQYVLGDVELFELFGKPERHLRCDTRLSQFIVHEKFPPVHHEGPDSKERMEPYLRMEMEQKVTEAWLRLREVVHTGVPLTEYPIA